MKNVESGALVVIMGSGHVCDSDEVSDDVCFLTYVHCSPDMILYYS